MEPNDFDVKEDEIIAKNDKLLEERKKRNIPLGNEREADDLLQEPPSPVINSNKSQVEEQTSNTTLGSNIPKKKENRRDMTAQQKADVATLDAERSAKDFSNMNTATKPRYEGKLKTTPSQENLYVDKKGVDRKQATEASPIADIEVKQKKYKNLYGGKEKQALSNFEQGYALYKNGDYKKSIRLFKKELRKKDAKNVEDIKYYLALALIQEGKEKEADELLAELEKGTRFKESARRTRSNLSR